jgi:hypothetical protein
MPRPTVSDVEIQKDPDLGLWKAAFANLSSRVRVALKAGASANAGLSYRGNDHPQGHFSSALAMTGCPTTAGLLLNAGADVHGLDPSSTPCLKHRSPLDSAILAHHPRLVRVLLDAGATPAPDTRGGWMSWVEGHFAICHRRRSHPPGTKLGYEPDPSGTAALLMQMQAKVSPTITPGLEAALIDGLRFHLGQQKWPMADWVRLLDTLEAAGAQWAAPAPEEPLAWREVRHFPGEVPAMVEELHRRCVVAALRAAAPVQTSSSRPRL